ncbi:MAG: hypothetical protein IRD7MM_06715 [Candidatus Midichloria mitochondrii]
MALVGFGVQTDFTVGSCARGVTVADLNKDGN